MSLRTHGSRTKYRTCVRVPRVQCSKRVRPRLDINIALLYYVSIQACACLGRARPRAQKRRAGVAYATPAHHLSLESSLARRPTPFRAPIIMHHLAAEVSCAEALVCSSTRLSHADWSGAQQWITFSLGSCERPNHHRGSRVTHKNVVLKIIMAAPLRS